MKRIALCTLLILTLVMIPVVPLKHENALIMESDHSETMREINFHALTETFGDSIPVVVTFNEPLVGEQLAMLDSLGIEFSFGSPEESNLGPYYLLNGNPDSLTELSQSDFVSTIEVQTPAQTLESTRDLSMPEIEIDNVWTQLDGFGIPLTGEGMLIADLDTGVDWRHPDLWFADGGVYDWLDDGDTIVENQTDAIDLDDSGTATSDEELRFIDNNEDGLFDAKTDWLWVDSLTPNGIPQIGEDFFVVNDTNDNGQLDVAEQVIRLNTPKTRYIVEKNTSVTTIWQRGVNLTSSTHLDSDGHGTAVAGVLLGGQLGHREYVGAAPGAELMMIRVLGATGSYLTVEEGLVWAYDHGADVILIEIGSWTYHYLDGSSTTEAMVDYVVSQGVPVIAPSGNLGGKDKHALLSTAADTPLTADFSIPPPGGPPTEGEYITQDIETVYITVLSVNATDFAACNFSVIFWMGGPMQTVYLHPGLGEWNWVAEPMIMGGGYFVVVESFISGSGRGTSMLAIRITGTLPPPAGAPWHSFNVTSPQPTTFHAYISDDKSSWTGGCIWKSRVVDEYEITWPSTADLAVSVASYRTRDLVQSAWTGPDPIFDLAGFSSRGPRIDEALKQGIAAPGGYDIISDWANASAWGNWYDGFGALAITPRFGGYRLFSGTSASGPHVAGAAAVLLQYNSSIGTEVSTLLTSTAREDVYTASVPNTGWGYGKLNVSAAHEQLLPPPPDMAGPTFGLPVLFPSTPQETLDTFVNITATDVSGVDTVILSWSNTTSWYNSTMWFDVDLYMYYIPAHPAGANITFMFYANDSLNNWATSPEYNFTVSALITTTTTTPTTTTTSTSGTTTVTGTTSVTTTTVTTTPTTGTTGPTTTTSTTPTTPTTQTTPPTTTTTTSPTTTTEPDGPDYLLLAIMLTLVLILIIMFVMVGRRRT
ncbi:MAG: S8 family serine peptidase [Candidatus Thorarchaeota archaeon]